MITNANSLAESTAKGEVRLGLIEKDFVVYRFESGCFGSFWEIFGLEERKLCVVQVEFTGEWRR
jgi:hypothetical protein